MYPVVLLVAVQGATFLPTQAGPALPPAVARKPDVVLTWNEVALQTIKAERTPPPLAARNLAIVHAAVYDAVNALEGTHSPYRFQAPAPPEAYPIVAAAIAAHRVLVSLYPAHEARFDETLDRCLEAFPEGAAKTASIALGQSVAEQILAWRSRDGAARQVSYTPGRMVGQWQPTPPEYKPPLLPQWTQLTCFCMRSGSQFRPAGPPPLTSQAYARSLNQVRVLGGTASSARTPEQTEIAFFWADGEGTVTPPGHWNRIAQTVARKRGTTLAENARLFALLNLALADAAILCWDCKYHYSFWRPITAIRYADRDGNPETDADPDWTPLLPTPPFPSYTSGHSSFSAAAATVLALFCGSDEAPFTSGCDSLPGVRRSYTSFSAAAREAGLSRIYGGIHYDFDNEDGLATGRALGVYVCRHFLLPQGRSK